MLFVVVIAALRFRLIIFIIIVPIFAFIVFSISEFHLVTSFWHLLLHSIQ